MQYALQIIIKKGNLWGIASERERRTEQDAQADDGWSEQAGQQTLLQRSRADKQWVEGDQQ